jgi:hypothetical protein
MDAGALRVWGWGAACGGGALRVCVYVEEEAEEAAPHVALAPDSTAGRNWRRPAAAAAAEGCSAGRFLEFAPVAASEACCVVCSACDTLLLCARACSSRDTYKKEKETAPSSLAFVLLYW